MNIGMLLPFLMGQNGNVNINELLIKMLTEKTAGSEEKIDPMAIMVLALMSNMNKNKANIEKNSSENIAQNNNNSNKKPDFSVLEKISTGDITEALKIMINNQNR